MTPAKKKIFLMLKYILQYPDQQSVPAYRRYDRISSKRFSIIYIANMYLNGGYIYCLYHPLCQYYSGNMPWIYYKTMIIIIGPMELGYYFALPIILIYIHLKFNSFAFSLIILLTSSRVLLPYISFF